mgnify:CR=1 FL=1
MKTTNHTTLYSQEMLSWSVTNGILAFAIVSGNCLILAAFCKNQRLLRMRTNYFILSLCVADLIVGLVSIPLTICEQFAYSDTSIKLPRFIHPLSLTVDIFSGFASIFALAMIALERVFCVYFPHKHKTTPRSTYFSLIALVWFLSGLMASLRLLQFFKVLGITVFFYAMFCLLLGSLLIMLLGYLCVWRRVRQRTKYHFHHRLTTQEKKFAVTLLIITATFIVTWMPFHVINIIGYFSVKTLLGVPFTVIKSTKLLQFCNSLANPIIYTFRIRDFRKTLAAFTKT